MDPFRGIVSIELLCSKWREAGLDEPPGPSAILGLGQGRSCCCRSDLRGSGSALRGLLAIPGVVHLGVSPQLFSDRVCQSRFCATAMGIRFCYEAAVRAGS